MINRKRAFNVSVEPTTASEKTLLRIHFHKGPLVGKSITVSRGKRWKRGKKKMQEKVERRPKSALNEMPLFILTNGRRNFFNVSLSRSRWRNRHVVSPAELHPPLPRPSLPRKFIQNENSIDKHVARMDLLFPLFPSIVTATTLFYFAACLRLDYECTDVMFTRAYIDFPVTGIK